MHLDSFTNNSESFLKNIELILWSIQIMTVCMPETEKNKQGQILFIWTKMDKLRPYAIKFEIDCVPTFWILWREGNGVVDKCHTVCKLCNAKLI